MLRHPLYLLWMLPALAVAAALFWSASARRRRLTRLLGDSATLARLLAVETPGRRRVQAALRLSALALLFVALAGPQWGVELVETQTRAQDAVIVLDVSLSMLAEDVKPSRLERAKAELSLLIDELKGSRIGVVAFAGEPAVVCPLTTDASAAKQLLREVGPGMVGVPGTGIGLALRRATAMLSRYEGPKTVVLLTDGEDHKTDPRGAAAEAAAQGIQIFAIGIGTPEGEPIPVKDASGAVQGYKKDKSGATVVSRLGEADLNEIAARTGGAYYRATPGAAEVSEIAKRLRDAGGASSAAGTTRRYKNHFMIPLALALALLLLEPLVLETAKRPAKPGRRSASGTGAAAALILLLGVGGRAAAASSEGSLRRGNKHYDREQYAQALEHYGRAAGKNPRDPRPVFNAGDAFYKLGQFDKAAEAFQSVSAAAPGASARQAAYYNWGNAKFQVGQYKEAVEAYRKAVALDPADAQARRNLAVALRRLKSPPPKSQSSKNEDKKKPQPQDQPKSGQGGGSPPPPKTRPQDQISKEDAQRILRAVGDKEKAARKKSEQAPGRRAQPEEDW